MNLRRLLSLISILILLAGLGFAVFLAQQNQETRRQALAPTPQLSVYVAYVVVPKDQVRNTTLIRSELTRLKELDINLVGQIFAGNSTETDWKTFADLAAEAGLKFFPLIRDEIPTFNASTNTWNLGIHGRFLTAMKDHPALYSMFLYDEPHGHGIPADQLALLYQQAKTLAPHVKMGVGFSGEIWRAETGQYGASSSQFAFRRGLCDICNISGLEFRVEPGGARMYQRDDAVNNHTYSRRVIAREAPEVEVWSTIQVFGSDQSTYYMPSPTELQDLIDLILSDDIQGIRQLDGLAYQAWADPEPGQSRDSLGDSQFEAHRNIVKATAIRLGVSTPNPTPSASPSPTATASPSPSLSPETSPSPSPSTLPDIGGGEDCDAPIAPQNVKARTGSKSGEIVISWIAAPGATHYALNYGRESRNYIYGASNVGNVREYVVKGLNPGTTYYLATTAVNACGSSPHSNETSAVAFKSSSGSSSGSTTKPTPSTTTFIPSLPSTTPLLDLFSPSPSPTPEPSTAPEVLESPETPQGPNKLIFVFAALIVAVIAFFFLRRRQKANRGPDITEELKTSTPPPTGPPPPPPSSPPPTPSVSSTPPPSEVPPTPSPPTP